MKKGFSILIIAVFLTVSFAVYLFSPFPITVTDPSTSSVPLSPVIPKQFEKSFGYIFQDPYLLDRPFRYLGVGGQAFVFTSLDDQHVLKFLRCDRLLPPWWIRYIPSSPSIATWRANYLSKKKAKLRRALFGHYLAYTFLKEESGLLAMQLAPSFSPKTRKIRLIAKSGISHWVDLNTTFYVLQERGEMLSTRLSHLLDQNQLIQAQNAIYAIASLYRKEHAQGLFDTDHGVMHNVGFVGERPIHMDVGCLTLDEGMKASLKAAQERRHIAQKIIAWIHKHYPHYEEDLLSWVEKVFE